MAASVKNARRKQYHTPGVVNGNLAREFSSYELERRLERSGQLAPDEYYVRRKESSSDILARQRAKAKAAVRPAQKVSPVALLGFSGVAVLMVALLLCYIRINAISTNIVDMKEQISALEVEQVSLLTRYERAFDPLPPKRHLSVCGRSGSHGLFQPLQQGGAGRGLRLRDYDGI